MRKFCRGGGKYSLLWCAQDKKASSGQILPFAELCVAEHVSGVFLERFPRPLERKLLTLFRAAKIPIVLLGGEPSPVGFPCDLAGINYIEGARRRRVDFSSREARGDPNLLAHGELFGDVAVRLMFQRLSYSPKHPPAEVYIDLPKLKASKKGKVKL